MQDLLYLLLMKEGILKFIDVEKSYISSKPILKRVNFSIDEGEFVYLTGSSGAGKTTFLKLIYRELVPDKGLILFDGINIAELPHSRLPYFRRNIGVVFQDFRLIKDMNVYMNIALPLIIQGYSKREIELLVDEVLERVGLRERKFDIVVELSGGEQQRVALARAIITKPRLILADEPTGNLDSYHSSNILSLLEEVHKKYNITVILATHDPMIIASRSHRVLLLNKGRVFEVKDKEVPPQLLYGEERWL